MRLYRSTLTLRSPTATLWQADTVWGHLCWNLVRHEGEDFLNDLFLEEYRQGAPPVLVSDGFPAGWLPRPRYGRRRQATTTAAKGDRVRAHRDEKDRLKASWLTLKEFHRVQKGEAVLPEHSLSLSSRMAARNQIDRLTSTTGESGTLYEVEEFWLKEVDLYWRLADDCVEVVRSFLEDLTRSGYGKRKSVGYGQVGSFTLAPFEGFGEPPEANGFVSLANFVPGREDPTEGYWSTTVKYGKLGEEAATCEQPFKRPLVQLTAGSCFRDSPVKDWYGRLVANVAADEKVVHYGYGFPVAMVLPQEEDCP